MTTTIATPDLIPIKRGAVVDWKATALAAHDARWAHQTQSEDRQRVIALQAREIADLTARLAVASKQAQDARGDLDAIRDHWSAFLLPTHLR